MTSHILSLFINSLWAMEPESFENMRIIVERHVAGEKLTPEQIRSAIGRAPQQPNPRNKTYEVTQGVAMVPVQGVLMKHAMSVSDVSGPSGTSYETIAEQMGIALADDAVQSIMLHMESPGGQSDGCEALYNYISAVAEKKPVWAFVDGLCASAAYYLASACTEVMATKSSQVGSIGTMMVARDTTKADEKSGVRTVVVRSGAKKALGTSGEPVTDAVIQSKQKIVDGLAQQFYDAVSSGRGLDGDKLKAVTDGDIHLAKDALALGLIDKIGSLEDAVKSMTAPKKGIKPIGPIGPFGGLHGAALVGADQKPSSAPGRQSKGQAMQIAPIRLAALVAEHPAHAVLITAMAVGSETVQPATEDQIANAIQAEDNKGKDSRIKDLEAQLRSIQSAMDGLRAANVAAVKTKDDELVTLRKDVADRDQQISNYKKGNDALPGSHLPGPGFQGGDAPAGAIEAFNAKVEEYRVKGHKEPFMHTCRTHPDLHKNYVRATNSQPGTGTGGAR